MLYVNVLDIPLSLALLLLGSFAGLQRTGSLVDIAPFWIGSLLLRFPLAPPSDCNGLRGSFPGSGKVLRRLPLDFLGSNILKALPVASLAGSFPRLALAGGVPHDFHLFLCAWKGTKFFLLI